MAKSLRVDSGTVWERRVGYSRAVRVGNLVEVAGTAAVDAHGGVVEPGDAYRQSRFILQKIEKAIQKTGGELKDVIRTRIFVRDISQWEEVGRAHGEVFHAIRPVTTMVEVSALIRPELVVEMEATAWVAEGESKSVS
jgi:enamine deaminase RidA (YjgF/YER057c/UK114 family)